MPEPPVHPVPLLRIAGVRRRLVLAVAAWLALITASCALVAHAQSDARTGVDQRFALRVTIASRFVTTYLGDLAARQADQARRHLSSRRVSQAEFDRTVADAGFGAAVLLDGRGRALRVAPAKPSLQGQDLAARYDHLRAAVGGRIAVSKVVPSAARRVPVVAVAVPFSTPYGQRVYSGAYNVSQTPVGTYLRNAIAIPQSRIFLLDPSGVVIASNAGRARGIARLREVDPALAAALGRGGQGSFDGRGAPQHYASRAIAGTPWRMVVAVPTKRVYAAIDGATRWVPWLAVLAFAVASLIAIVLFVRTAVDRMRLAGLNRELERLAAVDALTGLSNRRQIAGDLARAVSAARRHRADVAVLLIDVDHFKDINDAYGHHVGDRVLVACSHAMRAALRREDLLGRWGGEEFIAVLPSTDADGAVVVAERIRAAFEEVAVWTGAAVPVRVTASVGVAVTSGEEIGALLERTDAALYAAKDAGRNRVELAPATAAPVT
jgi:diguanylate cyclase (GGDEF)-like protein